MKKKERTAALIVAFVVVAAIVYRGRSDSPESQDWKRNAAAATKAEFLFEIDEPFAITRNGQPVLAIAGRVKRGKAEVGDEIVVDTTEGTVKTKLVEIQMFDKTLTFANPGDMIALLVQGIEKASIVKGSTIIMAK